MAITCVSLGTRVGNSGNAFQYVDATDDAPEDSLVVVIGQWTDSGAALIAVDADEDLPDQSMVWQNDLFVEDTTINANMGIFIASAPGPMAAGTRVFIGFSQPLSWGCNIALLYLTGVDLNTSRVDDVDSLFGGTTTNWDTPTVTASGAGALIGGAWGDGIGSVGGTVTSPATEISESFDSSNAWMHLIAFQEITTPGSYSIDGNFPDDAGFGHNTCAIIYKAAAAAGPEKQTSYYRRQMIMGGYR